ncbi:MAG: BACON domain-containing protein [Alistipes sp.]|nr:BACON domain-containing protein [Alistipes sp.]
MKRLLSIFALCAVALVACEEPKTDEQQEAPKIEFQITSEGTVEVDADGGELVIKYAITNPDASLSVDAVADVEWIAKSDALDAPEGEVHFIVEPNESGTTRFATVTLSYGEFSGNVGVEQECVKAEVPIVPGEVVELPHLSGVYFGNEYGATENDYNYSLALATHSAVYDIITGEMNLFEEQIYLFLDIYSSTPSERYNVEFTVPDGTYIVDVDDTAMAGTVSSGYSYLYDTSDLSLDQYVELYFVEGSVVVANGIIEATLTGEDGNVYKFTCPNTKVDNRDLFVGDWAYHGESFTFLEEDKHVEFQNVHIQGSCEGDYYVVGKNYWMLSIEGVDNDVYTKFQIELLAPFEDEIPEGEFPVSSDLDLEQMVLPSYINSYGDTEWSWYHWDGGRAPIVGGKITFVDNGDDTMTVVMDLVDDAGYKITGECTAEFVFYF